MSASASFVQLPTLMPSSEEHPLRPLDTQHAMMSSAMIAARRARLKVENDREALANRINRLAMEEVRATRRIEQTHRRTQEIISAKNRHAAQQTVKETLREEHEALVAEHREELSKVRLERKESAMMARQEHAQKRQLQMRGNRESAERNAEAIAHARASELNHAMYKRNEVRRVREGCRPSLPPPTLACTYTRLHACARVYLAYLDIRPITPRPCRSRRTPASASFARRSS